MAGERLAEGRLLLIADQGFGDVIQFSRYIPWARERCASLIIAGSAEMQPILHQMAPPEDCFTGWSDVPPYAAYAALSGLPRLHGTRVDSVPAPIPYLRARQDHSDRWRHRLGRLVPAGLRRIGLVWAGRLTHTNDSNRSLGLPEFAPLAEIDGIALLTLQKGPKIGQAGRYFGRAPLINLGAEIGDFNDTMAILEHIDLLVTVDTAVCHLAGALGRPVWILLPAAPDWRWLLDRDDTPWYPTARLFRQERPGPWGPTVGEVARALG